MTRQAISARPYSQGFESNELTLPALAEHFLETEDGEAQHFLGVCYERGDIPMLHFGQVVLRGVPQDDFVLAGVEKDDAAAVSWFQKAAVLGDEHSQLTQGGH